MRYKLLPVNTPVNWSQIISEITTNLTYKISIFKVPCLCRACAGVRSNVSEWLPVKAGRRQGIAPWLFDVYMIKVVKEMNASVMKSWFNWGDT